MFSNLSLHLCFIAITLCGKEVQVVGQEDQCHVRGTCLNDPAVGVVITETYNACLEACKNHTRSQCEWYTYFPDTKDCIQFLSCYLDPDPSQCENCLSGNRYCDPVPDMICRASGYAVGTLVSIDDTAITREDCLQTCKNESQCEWFTFKSEGDAHRCVLIRDLYEIDRTCTTCVTGQRGCFI